MWRLEAGVDRVGSSWCSPSSDRPRPSRPSWRRKAAGGPDLHPQQGGGPKRSGGWRWAAILFRDVKAARRRRKIVGHPPLPGRGVCRPDRPLRRPWAGSSPAEKASTTINRGVRPASPALGSIRAQSCWRLHEARHVFRSDLHPYGRPKRIDAECAQILVEVSELSATGRSPRSRPAVARSTSVAIAPSPAGSSSRAM